MGMESFKRSTFEKTAAAALAAASPVQAEQVPESLYPTYEGEQAEVGDVIKEEGENNNESLGGDEEEEGSKENWINWKEVPTPPSAVDSLSESERQNWQQNIDRLRTYATQDPQEHSANFLIRSNGTTEWFDDVILDRISYSGEGVSGQSITIGQSTEIVKEIKKELLAGGVLIDIHNHTFAIGEKVASTDMFRDIPPSPTDIFSILSSKNVREGMVVTESGEWRYGFKNEEARTAFAEAINAGSKDWEKLDDSKVMFQLETLLEVYAAKLHEQGQPKELTDKMYEFSKDHKSLREQIQNNYQLSSAFAAMVSEGGLFTDDEIKELGINDIAQLLRDVELKRSKALEKMDGLPVSSSELLNPPSESDKDHNDYLDRWQRLGAYIERVEPKK